ncbi:TIM21-domain-containing protein [Radiomyces spectabilis]|uniref:TIM21-domain-containing protein n=1 Tax=Radiomyces spectabilis TaxID=64574 RepID=UPI00221E5C86|nr:TIM21-domain-containing protein [Radiomyces spectabilis]KAI8384510.1 TIM21-domain-containing protein [Radiomyces spectabilis]
MLRSTFRTSQAVHSQLLRASCSRKLAVTRSFASARPPSPSSRTSLTSQVQQKKWEELTIPQKTVAATKATVNVGFVLGGFALTATLLYLAFNELFGSQSSTSIFNAAVDRIKSHEKLVEILGEPVIGHGEPSRSRARRNRRVQYQIVDDHEGKPHLFMRFYVEGPNSTGTCLLEMIKDDKDKWQYKQFFADVPGQGLPSRRFYLEQA